MFQNENVVNIMRDLYVKTPAALTTLLSSLKSKGYEIKDLRLDDYRLNRGATVETMEKNGWSLWFASMPSITFGKCNSCGSHISYVGIRSHGHPCEVCGKVTYYELVDGSILTFMFNNDTEAGFMSPRLAMKVKHWDTENSLLYLYPEFVAGGFSVVTGDAANDYLVRNSDKWSYADFEGLQYIAIKYSLVWNSETADIEPCDSSGHVWNHKIVKVYEGKEYGEYEPLPVPESMSIFETWHWAPLIPSPRLHERILSAAGQVSDKSYYYQDGRQAFSSSHWMEMAKFVRHFTSLDADCFDTAWPRFRNSGPGGIDDLARFCHSKPVVENSPNIGNLLVAASKMLSGSVLNDNEIEEARRVMLGDE